MLQWLFGKKKEEPKKEQKPKKSKQEQESEDKWQYEFLVQFLNSPLWRVSILDFVDQKCIVFDNEEENKFEYTTIHNEFKELVGSLFDGMMQQVGLDDDKLVELLEKGFQSKERKLFNQLLLCDDFLKFKDLMLRRNRALEEEAVKALKGSKVRSSKLSQERDVVHESKKTEEQRQRKLQQEEEELLRKVLEMSKIEADEREEIEKLSKKTEQFEGNQQQQEEKERREAEENRQKEEQREKQEEAERKRKVEEKKQQMKEKLAAKNANKLDPIGSVGASSKLSDLPPLKAPKKQAPAKQEEDDGFSSPQKVEHKEEIKKQSPAVEEEQKNVENQDDRKKRLMEQREKIRRKKEEERKKMLQEQQPKTQSIVLQDQGIHDSVMPEKEPQEKVNSQQIERRKEIMRKIKNRIVDDF